MMNNLEVWKGLDFTGFQEGDNVLLPEEAIHKMFYYGGGNWKWFHRKLMDVGFILKLSPLVEQDFDDELGDCWRISFVRNTPDSISVPDRVAFLARKYKWSKDIVGWELNKESKFEHDES